MAFRKTLWYRSVLASLDRNVQFTSVVVVVVTIEDSIFNLKNPLFYRK